MTFKQFAHAYSDILMVLLPPAVLYLLVVGRASGWAWVCLFFVAFYWWSRRWRK